ncbi:MAG TPA: phosphoribosylglycinamide formyltransferase, partial [Hellea balneolensis]|nr:phosphoribosylglycinamide formyltransferase [Hellea balneolensis]
MRKIRTAVLISGGGSNMEALATASQATDFPASIEIVISNKANAKGLKKAQKISISTCVIDHTSFKTREKFEQELHAKLEEFNIELICLAGFMRILTPDFVGKWPGRLINIHPSLLPKYKGLHTHQRAISAGDKEHGCTVHYVNEHMDEGKIIAQAKVSVLP